MLDFGAARDAEPTYTPGVRTVVDDMGEPAVMDVSDDDDEPQEE